MEIYAFYFRMNPAIFAIIISVFSFAARLVDHAPNFAPIGALAIWSGMFLPKRIGILLPLAVMFASDALIGSYDWRIMLSVYASFAITALVGYLLREQKSPAIVLSSLIGSLFFYLATNFAVWAFGTMYAHNWQGLIQCYYLALPFFRNTLYSDLIYGTIFVNAYHFAASKVAKDNLASGKETLGLAK